jgi:hypothetical protein
MPDVRGWRKKFGVLAAMPQGLPIPDESHCNYGPLVTSSSWLGLNNSSIPVTVTDRQWI